MRKTSTQGLKVHLQVASAFARKVKRASLKRAVQAAFESAGKRDNGALTLVIADDAQVKELNRLYRGVDTSTDVLAFCDAGEGSGFVSCPELTAYFGDIVISYPRAVEQAALYGHPVEEELSLLAIHGVLHLLGYDHERISDKEKMWRVQNAALARLGINWQL